MTTRFIEHNNKGKGWTAEPCPQGETSGLPNKLCYLAIAGTGGPPLTCLYSPTDCPFYGHFPDMSKNVTV